MIKIPFSKDILVLKEVEKTANDIAERLRTDVRRVLKRNGAVVGISGGIDSSVTLALAVKALGSENVIGIMMPEFDSSPESKRLAEELALKFGVRTVLEDMTPALNGFGCYSRRNAAVQNVIPHFNPATDKFKIEIKQNVSNMLLPPMFYVTVHFQNGKVESKILNRQAFLQIVAASNFKQRSRMSMLYFHAETNHYAVVGTPNRHEVEQGFFVKHGDGGTDVMPIAHLYKSQIYQLAHYLEIPEEIINRTPTSDTYPAEQTQEDFFFQFPFHILDILWYGWENGYQADEVANVMDYSKEEILKIYKSFERKVKTTEYLRMLPIKY